jgi:CubicO group peptidase (beta-lactamase class C family)
MRSLLLITILFAFNLGVKAQMYFPPNSPTVWDTLSPSELGWCETKVDSLYTFLESNNTKAFILLKDGKIVLENYFNGHSASTNWYWASAAKTLTAFMVGIAQQEGYLTITDTTSSYLGPGWTDCLPDQEEKITIWHQLTMTSGLDDGVNDPFCTTDSCLQYLADAGTRWSYHNGPYTLLDQVIESATGQSLNLYTQQKVKNAIGMDGFFIKQGYNNLYLSTARSMARFGLLVLNQGNWNGNQILTDSAFFQQMVNTSQNLNLSYGYLWWLNGKASFMMPQTQIVFNGSINPSAPDDMIAALGKNGQSINISPNQNLVWIRMGEAPDNSLVPALFNDDIWKYINDLNCASTSIEELQGDWAELTVYPNPAEDYISISQGKEIHLSGFEVIDQFGRMKLAGKDRTRIDISSLAAGFYFVRLYHDHLSKTFKILKQ